MFITCTYVCAYELFYYNLILFFCPYSQVCCLRQQFRYYDNCRRGGDSSDNNNSGCGHCIGCRVHETQEEEKAVLLPRVSYEMTLSPPILLHSSLPPLPPPLLLFPALSLLLSISFTTSPFPTFVFNCLHIMFFVIFFPTVMATLNHYYREKRTSRSLRVK